MLSSFLRVVDTFLHSIRTPRKRRSRGELGPEYLETRVMLSPWDGGWQFGPPPDAVPPHLPPPPYDLDVSDEGVSLIEVPGEGLAPLQKVKIKGDSLKAKVKSGDLKGKIAFKGTFQNPDNRSPNDSFDGQVRFTFRGPDGNKITLSFNVHGVVQVDEP